MLPADTSDAADPAKVETLNNPAVLRTLAFTVKVTEPLLPPMVVTVIVRVPGTPRTTVTVIDVVVVAPIDVTTSFTVPVAAGTVPPGTKFVPVSVTVTIWPATPDDGVIPENVGCATDEMRHAWRLSVRPPIRPPAIDIKVAGSRNWPLKALKSPPRSAAVGTYACTERPEAS